MNMFFNTREAIKIITKDMREFGISLDKAIQNYNNEWFNNTLTDEQIKTIRDSLKID